MPEIQLELEYGIQWNNPEKLKSTANTLLNQGVGYNYKRQL